jgi:Zn-dependent protease
MRPSIRLGTAFGIPIGFHWSAVAIVALVTLGVSGTVVPSIVAGVGGASALAVGLVVAVGLLASIVAHELGHALIARNNGVGTRAINLFALGGVAELESEATTPGAAARIALAGPAVSVGIGTGGLVAAALAGAAGLPALVVAALSILAIANLGMAVFNLVPALPLDGGRALQAALWHRGGDRERATLSAARVGRSLGWTIVALGAWQFLSGGSGLWTMVIGWFIVSTAKAEALRARFQIRARTWPAPMWWQWRPGDPSGRPTGPFVDLTGRPVTDAAGRPVVDVTGRPTEPPVGGPIR